MEVADITGIISSIGFPIAMCLILIKYISTTQKELITKMGEIALSISKICVILDERNTNNGKDEN